MEAAERPQPRQPLIQRLLAARGIVDDAEAEAFLRPTLRGLHSPDTLPGANRAAERLVHAIRGRESIVIYGDYDVDGIAATAILFHTIRALDPDARVATYVPHRVDEGYGLSADALKQLRAGGADLVISVDCGVTAVGPARAAVECGLDLIITDHHNPPCDGEPLPEAVAIVHPRLSDPHPADAHEAYPFADLCGAGVAFKLAWRLATMWAGSDRVGAELQKVLLHLLPLAALGTIADVVPLVDENRVIASFGLRVIKQTPLVGLRALIEATGLMSEKIDCQKVGFVLGPHLNACGRMGHAAEAVRMLTDATPEEAMQIASRLAQMNRERRATEQAILNAALAMAEDRGMTAPERRAIVLADESWHPGVVGIVCSRLTERFCRPAILLQRQNGVCKGSARSVEGYSIAAALGACREYLLAHGGHDMAAGLTLEASKFDSFVEALVTHANTHIGEEALTPLLSIDCDASILELTQQAFGDVAAMSPFGRSNPRPVVRLTEARIASPPRQIGSNGRHLSVQVAQDVVGPGGVMRAVWWGGAEHAATLQSGTRLDLAIEPKLNTWNGRTTVEGEIKDVRLLGRVS